MSVITDPNLADELVEMTPTRCRVMAARSFYAAAGSVPTSSLECCRCAMLAEADGVCEMCGGDVFRPRQRWIDGPRELEAE